MKFDIYEEVTNRIIQQLEKGIIPWHKPWKMSGISIKDATDLRKVAFNRITKTAYSALNQMLLSRAGEYASFKQWKDLGGTIKKGAKAEIVVFWKWLENATKDEKTDEEKLVKIPYLRYYQVFHIDDVDGVKPLTFEEVKEPTETTFAPEEQAEDLMNEYAEREKIAIRYGGNSAFYSPMQDYIQLPERFQFGKKAGEFYSTAFHEIVHSTGSKKRLDRLNGCSGFGSESYSKEELVAEIGSAGLLNILNLETPSTFTNSVAYIQSWIKALKNDTKMIVQASGKAEKAVRYIIIGNAEQEKIEGAA